MRNGKFLETWNVTELKVKSSIDGHAEGFQRQAGEAIIRVGSCVILQL